MRFTTLRVTDDGVVLCDLHRARLGDAAAGAFDAFARTASPGIFALRAEGASLRVETRDASRLFDGIGVRYLPSPCAAGEGARPKRPSPGPYDGVRAAGVATLLTSADGTEVYETCAAALVGWDGRALVLVPEDRPRVASLAEQAIASHLPHARAPLLVEERLPWIAVNAVAGPCRLALPAEFPGHAIDGIVALFRRLTRRP